MHRCLLDHMVEECGSRPHKNVTAGFSRPRPTFLPIRRHS